MGRAGGGEGSESDPRSPFFKPAPTAQQLPRPSQGQCLDSWEDTRGPAADISLSAVRGRLCSARHCKRSWSSVFRAIFSHDIRFRIRSFSSARLNGILPFQLDERTNFSTNGKFRFVN